MSGDNWIDRACDASRLRARGEASLRDLSAVIHLLRVRHRDAEADRLTALHNELAREIEKTLRPVRGVS